MSSIRFTAGCESLSGKRANKMGWRAEEEDEDINAPLLGKTRNMFHSKGFTLFILAFAAITVCVVVSLSTLGLAETADIADGKGGFMVHIHKQKADWGKTDEASKRESKEDNKVESLREKVQHLERELHEDRHNKAKARSGHSSDTDSTTSRLGGEGTEEDYSSAVERKEAQEEAHIRRKVDSIEKAAAGVDMVGLDAKHRKILAMMKREISEQNGDARRKADADLAARRKEIDALLPADSDCPGPRCLMSSRPHAPARASERGQDDGPKVRLVHQNPPWHKDYPGEFQNVYNSKDMPWLAGVRKVVHGSKGGSK